MGTPLYDCNVVFLMFSCHWNDGQGRSAEGALDALQKMQPSLATVLRDGVWEADYPARLLVKRAANLTRSVAGTLPLEVTPA